MCNKSSSQGLILGDIDQGHKRYSYLVPALRSALPNWRDWQTTNWETLDLPGLLLEKKKGGGGECYICLEVCLNKFTKGKTDYLRAWVLLMPRLQEKRMMLCMEPWKGCVCSPEQKMKARARNGGEARSSVMSYMMPLIFNKSATQCARPEAGNGRDHRAKLS